MSATVIRSPQEFLAELKKMSTGSPAIPAAVAQPEPSFAPLTLEQVNARIEEFSLALEGPLPDPVRQEIERRRGALVMEQFRLTHGYLPDADGNNPAEVKAIVDAATESATQKIFETLAAAPAESESSTEAELEPPDDEEDDEYDEEFDLGEQVEAMNEIDYASSVAVVSPEIPMIPAPVVAIQRGDGAVILAAEVVSALRASVVANMPHITAKILTLVLGK